MNSKGSLFGFNIMFDFSYDETLKDERVKIVMNCQIVKVVDF